MMLVSLDIRNPEIAGKVLELQTAAYAIESELIGYKVPALNDTVESLTACGERFLAYKPADRYLGVIGYIRDAETVEICRLVVDPNHFRQGVAAKLLHMLEQVNRDARRVSVATAAVNRPAVKLYEQHGYQRIDQWQAREGVTLVRLEKIFNKRDSPRWH